MPRRGSLVFATVSTIFFFASATTFQSMGVVVFAMAGEFGWSEAEAGSTFTVLVLACCATSLAPVVLIPRIGARWAMTSGMLILAVGFGVARFAGGLGSFFVAAGLFGAAFSLVANSCGIYLIAGWFGVRAPRMIGIYLMAGTISGAAGPVVADTLVTTGGGWRFYWALLSGLALAGAGLCASILREPPAAAANDPGEAIGWRYGAVLRSWPFAVLATSMVLTQVAIILVASILPAHFTRLGMSADFAAAMLSLQALAGTLATGAAGWASERVDPVKLLAVGLIAEALGLAALAVCAQEPPSYAAATLFGVGWAVSSLAITVLLIRFFGTEAGTAALSTLWLLSGLAAVGPWAAGLVADETGSFAPALLALAVALAPVAAAVLALGQRRRDVQAVSGISSGQI